MKKHGFGTYIIPGKGREDNEMESKNVDFCAAGDFGSPGADDFPGGEKSQKIKCHG
jgi:hypothetical protein